MTAFLEQVDYNGRRLAKLDVSPEEAGAALAAFDVILSPVLGGRLPAGREQLMLLTALTLIRPLTAFAKRKLRSSSGLPSRRKPSPPTSAQMPARLVQALAGGLRAQAGAIVLERPKAPAAPLL